MFSISDKLIVLIFSAITLIVHTSIVYAILPILVIITICATLEYIDDDSTNLYIFCGYSILCCFIPHYIYLFPVLFYDIFLSKNKFFLFAITIPYLINLQEFSHLSVLLILSMIAVALILKLKTKRYSDVHLDYINKRDFLTEMSISLENKIHKIVESQDYEINLATLNERNRIAREIHDNVGHLLTSSILQLGAIMAITKDEPVKSSLSTLKDTLTAGMDSIRTSVHDLRDDSVDLYMQLTQLVNDFRFCEAVLVYEIGENLNVKSSYAIIAIVKEALSNVMKHTAATKVLISLYEHPKLYQLIISDNGKVKKSFDATTGMGLDNINQRVKSLNGIINIDNSDGFRIFISFQKENMKLNI